MTSAWQKNSETPGQKQGIQQESYPTLKYVQELGVN